MRNLVLNFQSKIVFYITQKEFNNVAILKIIHVY